MRKADSCSRCGSIEVSAHRKHSRAERRAANRNSCRFSCRYVMSTHPYPRPHGRVSSATSRFTAAMLARYIVAALAIVEELFAFEQVFVIRIDGAADVAVRVRPLARFDIDSLPDQTGRLVAVVVWRDERALCGIKVDGLAGQLRSARPTRAEAYRSRPGSNDALSGARL